MSPNDLANSSFPIQAEVSAEENWFFTKSPAVLNTPPTSPPRAEKPDFKAPTALEPIFFTVVNAPPRTFPTAEAAFVTAEVSPDFTDTAAEAAFFVIAPSPETISPPPLLLRFDCSEGCTYLFLYRRSGLFCLILDI